MHIFDKTELKQRDIIYETKKTIYKFVRTKRY